jgi:hypothetical protein
MVEKLFPAWSEPLWAKDSAPARGQIEIKVN